MRGAGRIFLLAAIAFLLFFPFCDVQASIDYTIKKGDNFSKIAKKYHVSLRELQRENGVPARHLRPGTKIVIPGNISTAGKSKTVRNEEGSAPGDTSSSSTQDEATAAPSLPAAENLYHTVRKGDSLISIARRYAITVTDIKELNNLKSSKLKKGRKLLVKRIGPRTYTVKKGDNLRKIAKKFDMEADDLMEMNELESPSLTMGQKLYLEQKVDSDTAAAYHEAVGKNVEDEIKKDSESAEFADKPMQDKLIIFARKLINIPYKFGGNSILGIDCSAYVKKVYGFLGIELPRTAREQFKAGETVDKDNLSIGDLVFFRTYASFPSHVGIYLGNNLFIHASSKGKKVTIDSLETPYYLKRFIGGKRLLTQETTEKDPSS
jgi:peptidoglycan endopeptidase LytE